MTLQKIGYVALGLVAAAAIAIGSAGPSEAKAKKMAEAPAPIMPTCWFSMPSPVCATKGGMKFTYRNACYAEKDQAKVSSKGDCKPAKMAKKSMKKKKM